MINWIKYNNPLWYKVPFVTKHLGVSPSPSISLWDQEDQQAPENK
jgi:hypothetical protein